MLTASNWIRLIALPRRTSGSIRGYGNAKVYPPMLNKAVERAKSYYRPENPLPCHELINSKAITPLQHLFVLREMLKTTKIDLPILEYLGSTRLNQARKDKLCKISRSYSWIINAFYSSSKSAVYNPMYAMVGSSMVSREYFQNLGSQLLYDAYGLGNTTLDEKYRTGDVMAFLRGMRLKMDLSNLPFFADCLRDSGFGNTEAEAKLLEHYCNPTAYFSLGSWIFRASGIL